MAASAVEMQGVSSPIQAWWEGAGHPRLLRLTRREREVAAWLGEDVTSVEIAQRLGINRETIRSHMRNIGKKLGVRSRHAMVARLLIHGFVAFQVTTDAHGPATMVAPDVGTSGLE